MLCKNYNALFFLDTFTIFDSILSANLKMIGCEQFKMLVYCLKLSECNRTDSNLLNFFRFCVSKVICKFDLKFCSSVLICIQLITCATMASKSNFSSPYDTLRLLFDTVIAFMFWNLLHALAPMIWFYPLNALDITGYEVFCLVCFSPCILLSGEKVRKLFKHDVTMQIILLLMLGKSNLLAKLKRIMQTIFPDTGIPSKGHLKVNEKKKFQNYSVNLQPYSV